MKGSVWLQAALRGAAHVSWAIPQLVDLEGPNSQGILTEETDPVYWTGGVVVLESSSGVDTVRLHFLPPLTAHLLARSYLHSGSAGLAAPS